MRNFFIHTVVFFLLVNNVHAFNYKLNSTTRDTVGTYPGMANNGAVDIVFQGDSLIWFAGGGGLFKTEDFGKSFESYFMGDSMMVYGAITAVASYDSVIWLSAVFDSLINNEEQLTGSGLSFSKDCGETWEYIDQPIDDRYDEWDIWAGDTVYFLPVTTPVNNTTWDIAVTQEYVYIVSWAGGLRRSADFGKTWQRLPLPSDDTDFMGDEKITFEINPRDPGAGGNHNHKGFSVIAYGDTVWVGTANGINRGILKDDYIEWRKFNAQNSAISGNFVVSLHRQIYDGKEIVWAVTMSAEESGEFRGISYTSDGGLTWKNTLNGERGYSIASFDSITFISTENGLFKSFDGENWAKYAPAKEGESDDRILSEIVYCSNVDTRTGEPILWIGTGDGIAKKKINDVYWHIYHKSVSTNLDGQPDIYAYPNPFYPNHHNQIDGNGFVRVQYYLDKPADVILEIFNFGMERVYKTSNYVSNSGDNCVIWSGKTEDGNLVANGTYFCKITKKNNGKEKSSWTKLILVK